MKISQNPFFQIIVSAILLLIPLWYNGSPLYYPDSFGYIFWGMQMLPPPERAGSYAMFVKFFSLGKSFWYNILLQGIMVGYVLRLLFVHIFKIQNTAYFFFSAFLLGLGSSLGWTTAMLMPDIFCAVSSILLILILVYIQNFRLPEKLFLVTLFLLSSVQHVSIFLINLLIITGFMSYYLLTKQYRFYWLRLKMTYLLVAIGYFGIGFVHKNLTGNFFVSKTSNAFILSRLAETGILSNYLDENCGNRNLQLCRYRHTLPMAGEHFLWSPNSFIHSTGGLHDAQGAYGEVISGIFSSPKYIFQFSQAAFKSMMKQLFLVDVGDGLTANADAFQLRYYGSDYADFQTSKQHQTINFERLNNFIYLVFAGLIFIFIYTRSHLNLSPELKMFGLFLIFLFLANALVNGALSTPLNRYQVRVFWLADVWLLAAIYPAIRSYFSSVSTFPQ